MIDHLKQTITKSSLVTFLFILMIWSYLVKMGLFNTIVAATSLFGIYVFIVNRSSTWQYLKDSRFIYLFLLIWVPIILSVINNPLPEDTWKVVLNILRFFFISSLALLLTNESLDKIRKWILIFIVIISIDVMFEWLLGYHSWGQVRDPIRMRGPFERYPLGYFMGTIAPIIIYQVYHAFVSKNKWKYVWLFFALTSVLTVFVAGSRAGWVSLAVGIGFLFLWVIIKYKSYLSFKKISVFIILSIVLCIAILQIPVVNNRFMNPNGAASTEIGSYEWVDRLSSNRLVLWKFAWDKFEEYPILGAGAGSFEQQFSSQPAELKNGHDKAHFAHFFGLEVLSGTGIIGFISYIIMLVWIFKMIVQSKKFPVWLVVSFVAMMPINMHNALYSSFWAVICWIPLILGLRERYLLMQKNLINS